MAAWELREPREMGVSTELWGLGHQSETRDKRKCSSMNATQGRQGGENYPTCQGHLPDYIAEQGKKECSLKH